MEKRKELYCDFQLLQDRAIGRLLAERKQKQERIDEIDELIKSIRAGNIPISLALETFQSISQASWGQCQLVVEFLLDPQF